MATPSSRRRSVAALFLLALLPVLAAEIPAKGDLWEVTSKMSMEGLPMEMPAQTAKVCAAKGWTRPPVGDNEHQKCTRSEYITTDNKVTWTESCKSPPMTGKGEITRQGNDAYTGTIVYASAQGNMTIKLSGRKIGGCDNPS
jgi:uncharacterized protein DUF3617